MPLSGSAFWAVILPFEQTNLVTNPSFERGTQGWGTLQAGTIGTTSAFQQFGAWAGSIAPTSNGTAGVIGPTFTAANGSAYTFSAYVRGQSGIPYRLAVGDSSGVNFVGSTTFTGGGTWHRYVGSWTEASGATRRMVLTKNADADTGVIYIDGANVTLGSLSTHIDGDQEGCYWFGAPHTSQSIRSGTSRAGGSIVALADLGLKPADAIGAGMPPLDTLSQSFAVNPGAEFLRQRAGERPFTLTCKPISGTTQQDYHRVRRALIMALKADTIDPASPARLWYTGGQGTIQIDAVLDDGFQAGERNGPMAENAAIRFIAHDPYWYATTQQGTALSGRTALGSAKYIVARDSLGRWGTLGASGSTVDAQINALAYTNGTLFMGGGFGSTAGTRSGALSFYSELAAAFGTLGGTVQAVGNTAVNALAIDADGTVIFGGAFTNISGLSNTRFVARWASGFATITGGTVNDNVNDMAWTGGTLAIVGKFTGVAGTTTGGVALWTRAGYGSTSNGTIGAEIFGVAVGLDRRIFVGFQGAGAVAAGTTANHVAQYFGSWGTMGLGMDTSGAGLQSLAVGPNGIAYAGGEFQNAGGGTAVNVAQWTGVQWFPMGSGLGDDTPGQIVVTKMFADQSTGDVYGIGGANSGPMFFPDAAAKWNGYRWLPLDIDLPPSSPSTILITPSRTVYLAGNFAGTAQAAGVAQIINAGMADAYPTFKARNTSAGTIQIHQLAVTSTGMALYFDLRLEIGEEVTYVSEPGNRSFTSSFRGNIFSSIVPGSNITSFALKPGTNYVSFFASSGSITASLSWTPRSDSFDAGTVS